MNDIENRIEDAQNDAAKMEELIMDYLPYIKKQLVGKNMLNIEYDDMLSLAMLTFMNCVRQYSSDKGKFLSFCSTCIRNRLIDESRKAGTHIAKEIPLLTEVDDVMAEPSDFHASITVYKKEQERLFLSQEIDDFSHRLEDFGITFHELTKISPKQKRSRQLCIKLAKAITGNENFKTALLQYQRLAQTELAKEFDISPKTIEKNRKYIVTLSILLLGDYPGIKAYLPLYREVE